MEVALNNNGVEEAFNGFFFVLNLQALVVCSFFWVMGVVFMPDFTSLE